MWTRGVTRRAISGVLIFSVLFNVPRCFDHILSPGAGSLSSSFKSNSSVPAGVENVHVPSVNVKLSSTKFKSPLGADNINYDPKKCFSIENRTVATGHVRDSNCQSLDYQNAALSLINGDDEEGARDSLPVVGSLLDDDTNKWETTERGKIQRSNDSTRSESGIYFLYHEVYISYLTTFFLYLIPYTLIILFNARLLIALRRRREETRRVSVRQEHRIRSLPGPAPTDREDDLTYIVLGITFCFFVCCILPTVYMISALANRFSDNTTSILMTAGETTLVINASTDFLFYCLLGRKFRRVFMKLFCPKRYLQQTRAIRLTSTVSYSSV